MRSWKKKRFLVPALAVIMVGAGASVAFAYFTSAGTGSGAANVGSATPVSITQLKATSQVLYNSVRSPSVPDTWGLSYGGTGTSALGNEVNLASTSSTMKDAVVVLDSQACQTGSTTTCATAPGATFDLPITLRVYQVGVNGAPGAQIAVVTKTFTIPYRPSAAAVANPGRCASGNNWSGFPNDGSQWFDVANGQCYYGITYNATFPFPAGTRFPSTIIYSVSYDATSGPGSSLNFELANGTTGVSVGSNATPGYLFLAASATGAAGGANGQVTCATPSPTLTQVSTASGNSNSCGLDSPQQDGTVENIPQVEFEANGTAAPALYPGGPGEPVDFSVHNPGTGPEDVHAVSFSISSISGGTPSAQSPTCEPSWFTLVQPSVPVNATIPAGGTSSFQPSGALIALKDLNVDQDACQNATVNLTFTSN